ncbi:DNA glycosylase AlkZ-like family protein [Luteipulveratus mongoliensis]|uniref:Winged helix-turn-helix domain-containing protein n=1 Tax=Luteipulveratus mongoliensis TaxID=571913 RepID=A0A0K1JED6_9MICO|nr:crosslink repair DNA glycosylase YcaQ family protein [Luteipulveratus mongoliensis]AKU15077.1 hypothetical protein VV02_03055 [Luteipulveratus mongoliensis]
MAAVHHLTRTQARQIAIRAQLLDAPRPTGLVEAVRHLTLLQIDPTAAIAPNAHLVSWTRLGSAYDPAHLTQAIQDRKLVEISALIRPMEDIGLYLHDEPEWERLKQWVQDNKAFRRDILERLGQEGPLLSRDIPDTSKVTWQSTGWTNDRNVTRMLEAMGDLGDVAITGRDGKQRIWDLAERVYPADLPTYTPEEAKQIKDERRLRALGIARGKGTAVPVEPAIVGDAGEPAEVEGLPGEWRVDPAALNQPFEGRTALLSPFDRLSHDRTRALQLFDFEYTLEMYKPADKRRWGYFALPILHSDRLVGKVDAKVDRKGKTLQLNAIHQDVRFTEAMTKAVRTEIEALADWVGVTTISETGNTGA